MLTIYLCGFMGSGKTTVGKALCGRLAATNRYGFNFTDLDEYIVRRESRSIKDIFAIDGESYFRSLEKKAVIELSSTGGVVALGGGTILDPDTARTTRACGKIIYLRANFDVCYNRVMGEDIGSSRPLFSQLSYNELEDLYHRRDPIYAACSDYTIDSGDDVSSVVDSIISVIE